MQEVLKCVSGKFSPLKQFLYLDFREIAPKSGSKLLGTRYDAQIICVGEETSRRLADSRLFVVGSGAIGCELMKTLAMIGCSTGPKGSLVLTDDDNIERSNLNRQFLFRDVHIGKPKSETAKQSILAINPALKIDAHKRRVDPKSEDVYTNSFFEGLDCVLNALDNVEARRYVDHRITVAQRPLVESGTMGTKGHVQVIVPFLTETYGQQNDPVSKDVPFCTVKFFPHEINHCVQWARALAFQNNFVEKAKLFRQFLDTERVEDVLRSPKVRQLKPWVLVKLLDQRPASFQDCVNYARHKWERYFNHAPRHLLSLFPPNHTVDGGKLFWANPKRLPHPLEFSLNDPLDVQFVTSFANLWAFMWGLPQVRDEKAIHDLIRNAPVPPFVEKKKAVETDESVSAQKAEEAKQDKVSEEAIQSYVEKLIAFLHSGRTVTLTAAEFEKDDDSNFHIDCINAIANLRARVYRIPEVDRYETKKIAGRIIPAIAATTAVVSGNMSLILSLSLSLTFFISFSALSLSHSPLFIFPHSISFSFFFLGHSFV
jgi:ubiquitin-activating enzyme E1